MSMATVKGQIIADYATSKLGCAYIYGGYGEKKCTPVFRRERAKAYPAQKSNITKNCPVLSGKQSACDGCKWEGKQAYDCAQLTRYACKAAGTELVSGANSQWNKVAWASRGDISTLPDVPGVILYYMNKSGIMTHTGVYIGGGFAVEARGAKYGVVKTAVKDRAWTHWAALPGVLNGAEIIVVPVEPEAKPEQKTETQAAASGAIQMNTQKNGSRGTQVKVLQFLLNELGYACGDADGIFGKKTAAAVEAFQKAKGLTPDGICGKRTWTKLLA